MNQEARGFRLSLRRHSRPRAFRFFPVQENTTKSRGRNVDDRQDVIGFLGSDGALYCSKDCALRQGSFSGYEVDQDEYESLVESEALSPGALCPGCGAEFAVSWPNREPN